jgi:cytochrome P450
MGKDGPLTRVRMPNGQTPWLVTGHAECRQVLTDLRFSSNRALPGFPMMLPFPEEARKVRNLATMDPPEHTELKRMVISEFSARRMNALRPQLQQTADALIDAMLAGGTTGDLMAGFAMPFASNTICALLGVPYEDRDFFEDRSGRLMKPDRPEDVAVAYTDLVGYMTELVARKKNAPADDMISRLLTDRVATGELTQGALTDLALLLLGAGHAASAAMITIGTALLLRHPDQLDRLRADRSHVPGAIEEMLRYLAVADLTTPRVALADVEIGGEVIRAGDGVILALSVANRDEKVFADPHTVDVTRTVQPHVTLGHGPHLCIGANLVRVELDVAYETLFRRIPTLRLTVPFDELVPPEGTLLPEVRSLPVAW